MPRRHIKRSTATTTEGYPDDTTQAGSGPAAPAAPAKNAGATCKHANVDDWREYDVGKLHYLAFVVAAKQPQTSRLHGRAACSAQQASLIVGSSTHFSPRQIDE
jgi:hypothetical protein